MSSSTSSSTSSDAAGRLCRAGLAEFLVDQGVHGLFAAQGRRVAVAGALYHGDPSAVGGDAVPSAVPGDVAAVSVVAAAARQRDPDQAQAVADAGPEHRQLGGGYGR